MLIKDISATAAHDPETEREKSCSKKKKRERESLVFRKCTAAFNQMSRVAEQRLTPACLIGMVSPADIYEYGQRK